MTQNPAAAVPAYVTPYEFYKFYKDRCSKVSFSAVEVSLADLAAKVEEKPTDKEKNDLFKKYSLVEPTADKDTPGFKEPRKVSLEWLRGDDKTTAFYEKVLPAVEAGRSLADALTVPAFGGGAVPTALAAGLTLQRNELVVLEKYEGMKGLATKVPALPGESWYTPDYVKPRDRAVIDPAALAHLLLDLGGTQAPARDLAALATYATRVRRAEVEDRLVVGTQVLLGLGLVGPGSPAWHGPVAALTLAAACEPEAPPAEFYRPTIAGNLKKDHVQALLEADEESFSKRLGELAGASTTRRPTRPRRTRPARRRGSSWTTSGRPAA